MVRITGDIVKLMELAILTDSLTRLTNKLNYLNVWGEGHDSYINVDVIIVKVDLGKKEADVSLKFFTGDSKPVTYPLDPEPNMFGGLNIYVKDEDTWSWCINT